MLLLLEMRPYGETNMRGSFDGQRWPLKLPMSGETLHETLLKQFSLHIDSAQSTRRVHLDSVLAAACCQPVYSACCVYPFC